MDEDVMDEYIDKLWELFCTIETIICPDKEVVVACMFQWCYNNLLEITGDDKVAACNTLYNMIAAVSKEGGSIGLAF